MLAIVEAGKKWRHYVEGATHQVVFITDYINLQKFLVDKQLNGREARWWEWLSELDLYIQYQPEKLNPTDALSRQPDYEKEDPIVAIKCIDLSKIPKSEFIMQKYTSETALLQKPDQLISLHQSIKSEFEGP